ncbi:MAG: 3-oxoadipate enol-lactonase [Rhizobiales bacterium 24-66-13]|jgi:3-oxoadipate enol-lactonase|nr:MAG: 3-oxoadipate enol-lactonase [Rhizobiales bacterium 35-66-30]OYZ77812.1 MAG: 3-oxoadipate enol-lactonase [Rhizobiales bacterium 24-66-13]OZB10021.1 MAG: 3-oxoadipate enol-lactonase [Rhizobiales bacterium 39-66-18]HQS09302.1 3-oxoadipate enol-lactonase [Xanthobacteraceae bacterium]HQS48627.1 3-oxoadipate enol-lactonase [Xanthobacteraceae bacterium]
MPFLLAGEILTHYALEGPAEAPVLLLANSLGTNFHVWDPVMAALTAHFRVLRYDMRGHGLTDATPLPDALSGYSIPALAGDALALMDGLGIAKAHVCGLSIGGMVAQHLAAHAPERVDRLILCDTALLIGPASVWTDRIAGIRRDGLAAIAPGVMARWFTEGFRARAPQIMRGYVNMVARTTLDGYIGCALAVRDADLRPSAKDIVAPTLVLVGDQDPSTPPASAHELAAAIPGAKLELIADASHIPCVEQPAQMVQLVLAHLAR